MRPPSAAVRQRAIARSTVSLLEAQPRTLFQKAIAVLAEYSGHAGSFGLALPSGALQLCRIRDSDSFYETLIRSSGLAAAWRCRREREPCCQSQNTGGALWEIELL